MLCCIISWFHQEMFKLHSWLGLCVYVMYFTCCIDQSTWERNRQHPYTYRKRLHKKTTHRIMESVQSQGPQMGEPKDRGLIIENRSDGIATV